MLFFFEPPYPANSDLQMLEVSTRALMSYVRSLADFEESVLTRAWERIIQTHRLKRWPLIAEVFAVIHEDGQADIPGSKKGAQRGGARKITPEEQQRINRIRPGTPWTVITDRQARWHIWLDGERAAGQLPPRPSLLPPEDFK